VIPGSDRIPGSQKYSSVCNKSIFPIPNTRSQVSAKLKLSQLSTLQETLFIDLTLCKVAKNGNCEENGSLHLSLLDACMSALCSVLVIDVNWIAARMPHELARLVRH